MKSRDEILQELKGRLRLRHYSLATEKAYCMWAKRYYDYCLGRPKDESSEAKAEGFLTELAARDRLSAKSQNQALAALLFLYEQVLKVPLGDIDALRAKSPIHERTAPSREQVAALRNALRDADHTPARLLVDLLYGCGLRVSEPLELRIKDVLWNENQLVVRGAKGGKDRRVPIPRVCLEPLRSQVDRAKRAWEEDRLSAPAVGVPLPNMLEKKYPSAPFSLNWFWVFPAPGHCRDPLTGRIVRYHVLVDGLQRAVREAAIRAGLDGWVTPHVLRHAYATHSREPIELLQKLMGHSSIVTTIGYRHTDVDRASSPLDDLSGGPASPGP